MQAKICGLAGLLLVALLGALAWVTPAQAQFERPVATVLAIQPMGSDPATGTSTIMARLTTATGDPLADTAVDLFLNRGVRGGGPYG